MMLRERCLRWIVMDRDGEMRRPIGGRETVDGFMCGITADGLIPEINVRTD